MLLLVSVFLLQSKHWMYGLPLFALCCSIQTVKRVTSVSFFLRCNTDAVVSLLKQAFKWLLPPVHAFSFAALLTPFLAIQLEVGSEEVLQIGISMFVYAAFLLVTLVHDSFKFRSLTS